jgi:hypothetical protein
MGWFSRNWQNMLRDVVQLWVLAQTNMIKNMIVAIQTIIKLWWASRKALSNVWKQVFTVDFLKWVTTGIMKAGAAYIRFSLNAWKAVSEIFKRKGQKVTMADFTSQVEKETIGDDGGFLTEAQNILSEGLGDVHGIFEGFESSIEEAPEFVYDIAKQVGEAASTVADAWNAEMDRLDTEALVKGPSEAMVQLVTDIDALNAKMIVQSATFGMTARQAEIYKLAMRNASDEQLRVTRSLDAQLTAMEKQKKLMGDGERLTKKLLTPTEKYNAAIKEYTDMLDNEAITQTTFNRAIKEAQDALKKEFKVKFSVTGIQAVEAGTAEAMARLEQFRALKVAGAVAFDDVAKVEAREAIGKVTVGADTTRITMNEYLRQIAENTAGEKDRPVVVLQGANI